MSASKLLDHWEAPEGAGKAHACLATSFTFEPELFEGACLARFLALETREGASDPIATLIEQEEKLREVQVVVMVDRSEAAEGRSLRWDVLPVAVPGGLMHAKVSLLVWENLVRVIVSSANLTRAGYRQKVEAAIVLDADRHSRVPAMLFQEALDGLALMLDRAPDDPAEVGPKARARRTLEVARERIAAFPLPARPARADPAMTVAPALPGRSAFAGLDRVWRGGPPREAAVMSPFFNTVPGETGAVDALVGALAKRGVRRVEVVVPVDAAAGESLIRAPRALAESFPAAVDVAFREFEAPEEEIGRRLHAKVLVLRNDRWVAGMVGSSNFTAPGLGLLRGRGHLELNLWVGAGRGSRAANALEALVCAGEPLDPTAGKWEPEDDPEEGSEAPPLPHGFANALIEPGVKPKLHLQLTPKLPAEWAIHDPRDGVRLLSSTQWGRSGSPDWYTLDLPAAEPPFFLTVRWDEDGERHSATWVLNVTDPGLLAPPEELRNLPAAALLAALASTRPLHEGLARALARPTRAATPGGGDPELDPLRRYSDAGRLLHRARQVAAALAGLRRRLERPAASVEALEWRLFGPFGPVALAGKIVEESEADGYGGEAAFHLAELALTLSRTDWEQTAAYISPSEVLSRAGLAVSQVRELAGDGGGAGNPVLNRYVRRAFRAANTELRSNAR